MNDWVDQPQRHRGDDQRNRVGDGAQRPHPTAPHEATVGNQRAPIDARQLREAGRRPPSAPGNRPAENHHRRFEGQLANLLGVALSMRDDGEVALVELGAERGDGGVLTRPISGGPFRQGRVPPVWSILMSRDISDLLRRLRLPSYARVWEGLSGRPRPFYELMRSKIKPALALVVAVLLVVPLNAFAGQQRTRHGRRGKAALSASSQLHRTHARARHHRARASSRHRHHARVRANLSLALALRVSPGRRSRAAHVAGDDPSDTISDFKFTPATITIHAGDTITWTNVGPTEHTATASNGSFNTGILKKGRSASHTFTQPGTYAYIC